MEWNKFQVLVFVNIYLSIKTKSIYLSIKTIPTDIIVIVLSTTMICEIVITYYLSPFIILINTLVYKNRLTDELKI